MVFRMI